MTANWLCDGPDAPQIFDERKFAGKLGQSCARFSLPGQLPSDCRRVSVTMQVCSMTLPRTPCGPTPAAPATMLLSSPPVGLQPAADAQAAADATTTVCGATAIPAGLPVVESGVVEAPVDTMAVGALKRKPPAGVGVASGTANCRMLPLAAPVIWVTNAYAVSAWLPVRSFPNGQPL